MKPKQTKTCYLLFALIIHCLFCSMSTLKAQDIHLTSQEEVDQFKSFCGSCTELNANLSIGSNTSDKAIQNLKGLDQIEVINGNLTIRYNKELNNLVGLEKLREIKGKIQIRDNDALTSLNGLNGLAKVEEFELAGNKALKNCEGLDNLTEVEHFSISGNKVLRNFKGLESLEIISGRFEVSGNEVLQNFEGLSSLQTIRELEVQGNGLLEDFNGLESLEEIAYNFFVTGNRTFKNFEGLENLSTLCDRDGLTFNEVRIESNPALKDFAGLNNVTSIKGELVVSGNSSLVNFEGLENLKILKRGFRITNNESLENFRGLESLKTIGLENTILPNQLYIYDNPKLVNFSGLNQLAEIYGSLYITESPSLTSIKELANLTFLCGYIYIEYNDQLTSLSGLDNIEAEHVSTVFVSGNPVLSYCNVESICGVFDHLIAEDIIINNNLAECNSAFEVAKACISTSIEGNQLINDININIYPNPASTFIHVRGLPNTEKNITATLFDISGKQLLHDLQLPTIDISELATGTYFLILKSDSSTSYHKIIKQE